MISRLEAMTDESLGELSVLEKGSKVHVQLHDVSNLDRRASREKKKKGAKGR